jgi:aspartyl/glutamyl-tRNA(Asn/Gln) amidotransferase C subunit
MDELIFDHLCDLSKLSFSPEERAHIMKQMTDVIALMDTVKSADLDYDDEKDGGAIRLCDLRADRAEDSFERDMLQANTKPQHGCYTIPRLME